MTVTENTMTNSMTSPVNSPEPLRNFKKVAKFQRLHPGDFSAIRINRLPLDSTRRWISSQSDFLQFTLSAAGLPNLRRLDISVVCLCSSI
jgi:hypothetical protein